MGKPDRPGFRERGRAKAHQIIQAKAADRAAFRAELEAQRRAKALPGERFNRWWCQDVAIGCTCTPEPWINQTTIETISTARGIARHVDGARGPGPFVMYDRCLGCGATWLARDYRCDPSRPVVVDLATIVPNDLAVVDSAIARTALDILNGATPYDAVRAHYAKSDQSVSAVVRQLQRAGISCENRGDGQATHP